MRSLVMIAKCLQVTALIVPAPLDCLNCLDCPWLPAPPNSLSLEPGQLGGVWGQGALHGGGQPLHPQEQGEDGRFPRPPLQRQGEALPGRGDHYGI